jgi:hypothetical protein
MPIQEYPKLTPAPFRLNVRIEGKNVRLVAVQTLKAAGEEHYLVTAKNKTLVFSTNRPIIERRGLKDFPWTWKIISGQLHNSGAKEAIIKALERHLRSIINN